MKIVKLERTCFACPEQWEGVTEDGSTVYARERHGEMRVELNGEVILRRENMTALDGLYRCFEIPVEVLENSYE